jgi:hypothetical protein
MRLHDEPRISWRGVILVAVALAFIALALFLRQSGPDEWRVTVCVLGIGLLAIGAVFFYRLRR